MRLDIVCVRLEFLRTHLDIVRMRLDIVFMRHESLRTHLDIVCMRLDSVFLDFLGRCTMRN